MPPAIPGNASRENRRQSTLRCRMWLTPEAAVVNASAEDLLLELAGKASLGELQAIGSEVATELGYATGREIAGWTDKRRANAAARGRGRNHSRSMPTCTPVPSATTRPSPLWLQLQSARSNGAPSRGRPRPSRNSGSVSAVPPNC